MMLSIVRPENQALIDYAGNDNEWDAFSRALKRLPRNLDIPLIIGGKEIYTDDKVNSINPSTGETVCTAQKATGKHTQQAIEEALAAKKTWAALPPENRINKFRDLEKLLYARRHEICATAAYECGYPATECSGGWAEMMDFIRFNTYYYHDLHQLKLGDGNGETNVMRLRALKGFTCAITPFNFPVAIGYNLPTVMALCGNTVLWKPSSDTPMVAWLLMQCLQDAGFPDGVINMVTGPGKEIMGPVLSHPQLTAVNFTGSFEVAKRIGSTLHNHEIERPHFPRLVAETGGKDFMVVDKDADIYDAAGCIIAGAFGRSGQKCSANSLVLVNKAIWTDLKASILEQMAAFKMKAPVERDSNMGPVINHKAFDDITGFIKRAKDDNNCNIFHGGGFDNSKGLFIEPTCIEVKKFPHELLHTEIFGPVVAFYVFENVDQAIKILEHNTYRLTGGVWSANEEWLVRYVPIFSEYAGNFYVNRKITAAIVDQQPFGGDGASGTNYKAGGLWYLLQFISQGTITRRHLRSRKHSGIWEWVNR